jgi:hypothetical protein
MHCYVALSSPGAAQRALEPRYTGSMAADDLGVF